MSPQPVKRHTYHFGAASLPAFDYLIVHEWGVEVERERIEYHPLDVAITQVGSFSRSPGICTAGESILSLQQEEEPNQSVSLIGAAIRRGPGETICLLPSAITREAS